VGTLLWKRKEGSILLQKGLQRGVESEMRVVTVKEQIEKLYTLSYFSLTKRLRVKN
jgi:hypothetical protein